MAKLEAQFLLSGNNWDVGTSYILWPFSAHESQRLNQNW